MLRFQVNQLLDWLERDEEDMADAQERIWMAAELFMAQIELLTI